MFEDVIDPSEKFTYEEGLFLAAGITEYDNNPEMIEDLKYGELVFDIFSWSADSEEIALGSRNAETHPCTEAELGLVEEPGENQ